MTTLITGASSGIGEVFARELAKRKHNLFLIARSEDKLRDLCKELSDAHGVRADFLATDLGKPDGPTKVCEESQRLGIDIDVLINNAGFGSMGDFSQLPIERELEMVDLNIRGLVEMTHRFLAPMRERRRGTIINVSSTAGAQPIPFMSTYAATKAFVTSFSEAIAEENRPFGIHVFALCPGATKTSFFEAGKIEQPVAVKGFQTPEEVVATALAAIGSGRSKVTSGWINWLVATAANVIPNSLIAKSIAARLRPQYQKFK